MYRSCFCCQVLTCFNVHYTALKMSRCSKCQLTSISGGKVKQRQACLPYFCLCFKRKETELMGQVFKETIHFAVSAENSVRVLQTIRH